MPFSRPWKQRKDCLWTWPDDKVEVSCWWEEDPCWVRRAWPLNIYRHIPEPSVSETDGHLSKNGTKERAVWTSPGSPTPSKHLLEPSAANWRVCSIYFNLSSMHNTVFGNCSCMLSFHTHMIHKITLGKSVFSLRGLSHSPEKELEWGKLFN